LAGIGAGGGHGIDGAGAGEQSERVVAAGHLSDFRRGQERADVQPRFGGSVGSLRGPAMGGTKERQAGDGNVAGATVASLRNQAANDSDRGASGQGLREGGNDGNVPAVHPEIGIGGTKGGFGGTDGEASGGRQIK